jgi:hypothetical protein
MVMRVITLLRGVLDTLGVTTVSSALLWAPLAAQVREDYALDHGQLNVIPAHLVNLGQSFSVECACQYSRASMIYKLLYLAGAF